MHKLTNMARASLGCQIGDIKPGEIGLEFFRRLAWDITPWNEQRNHLSGRLAKRNFGSSHPPRSRHPDEYYRLISRQARASAPGAVHDELR